MKAEIRLYRLKDTESNRYLDFTYPCEVKDKKISSALVWDEIVEKYCYWRRLYRGDTYIIVDADTDEEVAPNPVVVAALSIKYQPEPAKTILVFNGMADIQGVA